MTTEAQRSGGSLTHSAYEKLRDDVLSGQIAPGQKLKIHDLVERLGANQGAVREALSRLASEGLAVAEPQKGFRASPISAEELLDLTRVRIDIEKLCLERALALGDLRWESQLLATYHALSRTPEKSFKTDGHPSPARMTESWSELHTLFHQTILAPCDSPWLLRIRAQLHAQAERYRRLSVPLQTAARDTNAEHAAIMDAVLSRDVERAAELLESHFKRTTSIVLKALNFETPPQPTVEASAKHRGGQAGQRYRPLRPERI